MRGKRDVQPPMFFVIDVEARIRSDHPLRPLKRMIDEELAKMSPLFDAAYSDNGRPGVPPERLLKALLLRATYSVRSETQLIERLDTDLLFRWSLDMDPAEPAFDPTAFTHDRPRLERHGIVAAFFDGVVRRAMTAGLTSDGHFSVDGTLIESHASIKSFVPEGRKDDDPDAGGAGDGFKPRNAEVDFHGQKRSDATHASRTDPDARLFKKASGQPAELYHAAHAIAENRHGLAMAVALTRAAGDAEPAAALAMADAVRSTHGRPVRTLGSDKGYDGGAYLIEMGRRGVTPHTALRAGVTGGAKGTCLRSRQRRASVAPRLRMKRRQADPGCTLSQRCRKKIEEAFGRIKTVACLCRTRPVGQWKIKQQVQLAAAAYNLVRMRKLAA